MRYKTGGGASGNVNAGTLTKLEGSSTDAHGNPENREDPGPIWKQTISPRVLDRVFGCAAAAASSTTGTAG